MPEMPTNQGGTVVGSGPRLDSWKEIATYLKRGVRTVRRWEQQEGLPAHRHRHGKQATVYAYAHEIDTWLRGRSAKLGPHGLSQPPVPQLSAVPTSERHRERERTLPLIIAILPLHSVGGDPEEQRFADGLTEELISEVGQCCPQRLRVIGLTSVMRYKRSHKNIEQVGRELGADFILEGGIRRYGRRVRLTARLLGARDQAHVWADSYEVQLPPIFSLQQSLARQVAHSLSAELGGRPTKGPRRVTLTSVAAHNAYILGSSHFMLTDGEIRKNIENLNLAIERDPKFAPSYAELALTYFRRFFSDYPPVVTFKRIEELASKALKLNSKLARAHAMLAAYYLFSAWAWSKADAASKQAVKLNPSDVWARIVRVSYYVVAGQIPEAVENLREAQQMNPMSPECGTWFAILAYLARHYDLAIDCCQAVLRLDPSLAFIHRIYGFSYAQMGDSHLAISHAEKIMEFENRTTSDTAAACSIYALANQRDSAERLFNELVAAQEQQYMRFIFLAQASVSLGKDGETLDFLEKAYQQRDPLMVSLKADARFDALSGNARFQNLLRRVGLPSALQRPAASR
jgi:TolB-like protein/tetratricopeptide (TPR) repeat protein